MDAEQGLQLKPLPTELKMVMYWLLTVLLKPLNRPERIVSPKLKKRKSNLCRQKLKHLNCLQTKLYSILLLQYELVL